MTPQEFAGKIKSKYPQYAQMDDNELTQRMVQKYPQYASQVQSQPQSKLGQNPTMGSPLNLLGMAAPSNSLKLAGIGGVNAPGVAGAAINSLPGIGNPSQIMPSIQNIRRDPGQLGRAFGRMASVQGGGKMTPQEKTPAALGQGAGMAMEMFGVPSLGTEGVKAKGPFTAGLKSPETALPGEFDRAGEAYGKAKDLARKGEDLKEAARLRGMLGKSSGVQKLAEEGKRLLEAGKKLTVTQLMAYREALGKMQAEGGVFANDYAKAKELASSLLKQQAPDVTEKMGQMATNFAAKGNANAHFPWFTTAMNPQVGLLKSLGLPAAQNTAGALASPAVRFPTGAATLAQAALRKLRENLNP